MEWYSNNSPPYVRVHFYIQTTQVRFFRRYDLLGLVHSEEQKHRISKSFVSYRITMLEVPDGNGNWCTENWGKIKSHPAPCRNSLPGTSCCLIYLSPQQLYTSKIPQLHALLELSVFVVLGLACSFSRAWKLKTPQFL